MGSIYDGSHSYAGGFVALAFVAAATTALVVLIARCRDGTDAGVTPANSAEDLRPGGSDLRPRARGRLAGER